MDALLKDPCCVLGLSGAGFVARLAVGAALVDGAQRVAGRLRASRAVRDVSPGALLKDGGVR